MERPGIEWAPEHARTTGEFKVRDSKAVDGPHLTLSRTAFTGLITRCSARPERRGFVLAGRPSSPSSESDGRLR